MPERPFSGDGLIVSAWALYNPPRLQRFMSLDATELGILRPTIVPQDRRYLAGRLSARERSVRWMTRVTFVYIP